VCMRVRACVPRAERGRSMGRSRAPARRWVACKLNEMTGGRVRACNRRVVEWNQSEGSGAVRLSDSQIDGCSATASDNPQAGPRVVAKRVKARSNCDEVLIHVRNGRTD
jgi:hypothetical protein